MFKASHKTNLIKFFMFTIVVVVISFCLPCDAGAVVYSDVIDKVRQSAANVIEYYKPIVYILGGFGLVCVAWGAIFGKMNWKWFANLAIGLFLVAWMGHLIDYFTRSPGEDDHTVSNMFQSTRMGAEMRNSFGDTLNVINEADSGTMISMVIAGEENEKYDFYNGNYTIDDSSDASERIRQLTVSNKARDGGILGYQSSVDARFNLGAEWKEKYGEDRSLISNENMATSEIIKLSTSDGWYQDDDVSARMDVDSSYENAVQQINSLASNVEGGMSTSGAGDIARLTDGILNDDYRTMYSISGAQDEIIDLTTTGQDFNDTTRYGENGAKAEIGGLTGDIYGETMEDVGDLEARMDIFDLAGDDLWDEGTGDY